MPGKIKKPNATFWLGLRDNYRMIKMNESFKVINSASTQYTIRLIEFDLSDSFSVSDLPDAPRFFFYIIESDDAEKILIAAATHLGV